MFSWYSKYKGRSIGRILHALNVYCGLHIAERACVNNGKIFYPSKTLFATYEWEGDSDIPNITFLGENKEFYSNEQTRKKDYLDDPEGWLQKGRFRNLKTELLIKKLEKMIKLESCILNPGCDDEINYKEVYAHALSLIKDQYERETGSQVHSSV